MSEPKKNTKMTVFKTDRHEDLAAMFFVTIAVVSVLVYMAYIVPSITLKAPMDGKVVAISVQPEAQVKKGDLLYSMEIKQKKYVHDTLEEKIVTKDFHAKTSGKILSISAKPGDVVKKDKNEILVLEHEKGVLP
jgi:multidrug efflux pump subunit AcrA (membrane-fusion protein)